MPNRNILVFIPVASDTSHAQCILISACVSAGSVHQRSITVAAADISGPRQVARSPFLQVKAKGAASSHPSFLFLFIVVSTLHAALRCDAVQL